MKKNKVSKSQSGGVEGSYIHRLTREESEELDRKEAAGIVFSTRHPTDAPYYAPVSSAEYARLLERNKGKRDEIPKI